MLKIVEQKKNLEKKMTIEVDKKDIPSQYVFLSI